MKCGVPERLRQERNRRALHPREYLLFGRE